MLAGKSCNDKNALSPLAFPSYHAKVLSRLLPICGLLILANVALANGQSYHGGLRGSVQDGSANVMPAVSLTLTNEETNVSRATVTNDSGEYVFERVDPGRYRMMASAAGFKKLDRPGVIIATQQQIALDLTLEVGDVAETVTVTDEMTLIESSTSSTGQVIAKQVLDDLPNSGRNPFMMSAIVPNVIPAGNPTFNRQQDQSGSSQISLAGGPVRGNNYLLDGVPITDLVNRAVIIPSIEAVQELKVQVNTYDAEAGRTGGGVFNVAGKSGSNQWHGSLFGFIRPSSLQANNFFANRQGTAKPDAPYKLYGGSIGGPVYLPRFGEGGPSIYDGRDRTFFWVATEGYRMQTFLSDTIRVPTARERVGDFSQTRTAAGQLITIYDPLTTRPDPANPGRFLRDPFPGNIIPTNRFDPAGYNLLQYFPQAPSGVSNYSATSLLDDRADQQTFKLDHAVNDNYKISGMYAHYGSREPVADYYNSVANPGGTLLFRTVHAVAVNNIFTLSPTSVLSVRYGYNTFTDSPDTISAGFAPASLGFASSFTNDIVFDKFPRISAGSYGASTQAALGSGASSERRYYSQNLLASVSKLIGRHSIKIGGDYRKMSSDFTEIGQASGDFSFTRAFTQLDPNRQNDAQGNEIASLLLGYANSGSAQIARPLSTFVNYYAGYVHDDFRFSQKLTLNLGLRYEYEQGLQEKDNQLTVGFDRSVASPLQATGLNLRGGLLYAGVDGNPTQQVRPSKTKFGPRIGFAYSLSDKTTIRAGYGVFWAPPVFAFSVTGIGALGFSSTTSMVASTDGNQTPASTLSNPFPNGLVQPTGNSLGLLTQIGQTVDFVDQDRRAPYVQQYSIDVQHELPGAIALSVSYVGSRGTHLQIGGINDGVVKINQLTPEQLALGSAYLQTRVTNPFPAEYRRGVLSGATIERRQLLRPFPQFGEINMHGSSGGNSFYNSGTVKAQKRLSRGLTFLTSYTFSRMLDNIIGQSNFYSSTSNNLVNSYNLAAEYSLSSVDTPHRYLMSGTYELPFGRGRRFLSNNSLVDKFVGGWQINAIGTYQSGFPLSVTQNINNTNAFSGTQRPNAVAGVSAATDGSVTDRIDNYLNRDAFTQAASFTFGNLARTIDVRTPAHRNWDIGLLKNTMISENFGAQFRVEAINALNTPTFRAPNTTFGNENFGKITSQANFARVIQLSVRLFW